MSVRNLTKRFIDIRNAAKANRSLLKGDNDSGDSDSGLLNTPSKAISRKAKNSSLPPAWVDQIEEAEEDVAKIQLKVRELTGLHTKRLMVNFQTDEVLQEREIDYKTREITECFHHAESVLKKFSENSKNPHLSAADKQVRKNMQMSVARKIQGLSMSFRSSQKQYMAKLQSQKQDSGSKGFDFLNEPPKKTAVVSGDDLGFNELEMQMLEETEDLVRQRDDEIVRIAKSIEELAQIFKELAVLVIDQGTILDRIDYNMENAVEHAKSGVEQLQKAETQQKKNLAIKCIILLVLLNIIMVGILVWKHSSGK